MILKNFFLCLILLFSVTTISNNGPKILFIDYGDVSYGSLYLKLLHSGVKYPDVVFAQAVIESAHFTSEVFKSENNLFGMKHPARRQTLSDGKAESGYASYNNWTTSVEDYKLWQYSMLKQKESITKTEYLDLLGRIYATDPKYVRVIKKVMLDHQDVFKNVKTNLI